MFALKKLNTLQQGFELYSGFNNLFLNIYVEIILYLYFLPQFLILSRQIVSA